MELLLNAYAAKVAKGHCADFLGFCEVSPGRATSKLTSGLWLVRERSFSFFIYIFYLNSNYFPRLQSGYSRFCNHHFTAFFCFFYDQTTTVSYTALSHTPFLIG